MSYSDADFERDVQLLYARGGSVPEGLAAEERIIADRNRWRDELVKLNAAYDEMFHYCEKQMHKRRDAADERDAIAKQAERLLAERDALKAEVERLTVQHQADDAECAHWKSRVDELKAEVERLTAKDCPDCEGIYSSRLAAAEKVCEAAKPVTAVLGLDVVRICEPNWREMVYTTDVLALANALSEWEAVKR